MANRIAFEMSDSFSSSEASDAGSSASHWINDDPVPDSSPVIRSASPAPSSRFALPLSSSTSATVRTVPTMSPGGPQPGQLNAAISRAPLPALVVDDGALTINDVHHDHAPIRAFLLANPGIKSVVITEQTTSGNAELKLLEQFDAMPSLGTIKLDLVANRTDGPRLCGMEYDVEDKLVWLFAGNPNLTKLDLSGQGIRSGFLFKLAEGLGKSKTFKILDLNAGSFWPTHGEATFYGEMARGIADIIEKLACVSTILASSRQIKDDGAMQIAAALRKNTGLTTLVLAANPIFDKGYAAIFDALRKNKETALQRLDLSAGRVGLKAAKSLARLLKKNTPLVEVAIGTVHDVESLRHIWEGLLKNTGIVKLSIICIDNGNKKFLQIRSQINAELQRRAASAGNRAVMASTANTANGAITTTTTTTTTATTHAKAISTKDPG